MWGTTNPLIASGTDAASLCAMEEMRSDEREIIQGARLLQTFLKEYGLNFTRNKDDAQQELPRNPAQWRLCWDTVDGKTWWTADGLILCVDPVMRRCCFVSRNTIRRENPAMDARIDKLVAEGILSVAGAIPAKDAECDWRKSQSHGRGEESHQSGI